MIVYSIMIVIGCAPMIALLFCSLIEYFEKCKRENAQSSIEDIDQRNSWMELAELHARCYDSRNRLRECIHTKYVSCPNCGAPIHNNKCEYCGSEF